MTSLRNVINVVEWAYRERSFGETKWGKSANQNLGTGFVMRLAHTMGVSVAEIRYFKSARPSGGTEGYRPKLHHLYNETKLRMENFRALAQAEEAKGFGNGIPDCFHSNVLYKRADRKRFETDPVFRSDYRKANLRPVWEILGPLPPQNVVQAEPSIPLDADHSVHVNREDGAQVNERTGQQRGRLPAYVETKIEKKDKEKRKRTARVQRGIRGLLSRINFFS
ncbi:hypothetical protein HO133_005677 [Letharia lupina]|uniref:Uncharacterized protein n=1 Tax=Letharia lupina TaxID=560253 RepID=A0A8H6F7R8_9LECA|nr:uncharacterized protein HO133_005677 [Letharia lupina]KAF6218330.1 hypothetical protein HO133_005677 [Letharia lupina]